jgi:hypothetical protein
MKKRPQLLLLLLLLVSPLSYFSRISVLGQYTRHISPYLAAPNRASFPYDFPSLILLFFPT